MFSVQRFDGSAIGAGQAPVGGDDKPDRIALINQRKARQSEASSSKVTLPSSSVAAAAAAEAPNPVPSIHPSRLAASHVLRQADRKQKSSLQSGAKEKTKAKQRYLKTKKERRKKKKAVEATKGNLGRKEKRVFDESVEQGDVEVPDKKKRVEEEKESEERDRQASPAGSSSSSSSSHSSASLHSPSEEVEEPDDDADMEIAAVDLHIAPEEGATAHADDAPVAALSRFPAPQRTLQASRKDLAAQGLPLGLAYPQLVDPSRTMSVKKSDQADLDQISPAMKARLAKLGITHWFAVQTAVIPALLSHPLSFSLYPSPPLPDLCVSAPTGSGKTLSYAVPIVEVLQHRLCRRLRALIILPTRELVNQVKETMVKVSKGTSLTIAAITGQQSFSQEQDMLVESVQRSARLLDETAAQDGGHTEIHSRADILIATPGRFIDHLDHTPGLTLQHLRFLVIDEADRLLGQSFQEWLPRLLDSLDATKDAKADTPGVNHLAPAWMLQKRLAGAEDGASVPLRIPEQACVQKLLFSATLTRDPAKILALQLRNAAFVSVEQQGQNGWTAGRDGFLDRQESFALPSSLQEHMVVTKGEEKPLQLLHLLFGHEPRLRKVLCFTKSVENASRLVKLVDFFNQAQRRGREEEKDFVVHEYSSDLNGAQRSHFLAAFAAGKVDLLVCSDVMARGMDLPDVQHVISYDVPVDMAKYVHRVGRTARANREGHAWTLVEEQEARHFKAMMKRGGRRTKMIKLTIQPERRDCLRDDYSDALARLESVYARKVD